MSGTFSLSCNPKPGSHCDRGGRGPVREPGPGEARLGASAWPLRILSSAGFGYPVPFHVDHIIARQHGGSTVLENLALACLHCNRHKGPNIAGTDPKTGELVRLFHPRMDEWNGHFEWTGATLAGRTAIGRVTIHVLAINGPDFLALREV